MVALPTAWIIAFRYLVVLAQAEIVLGKEALLEEVPKIFQDNFDIDLLPALRCSCNIVAMVELIFQSEVFHSIDAGFGKMNYFYPKIVQNS